MGGSNPGLFTKLMNQVFPRMPDFHGQLNDQCAIVAEAAELFVQYMKENNLEKGEQVAALEHKADEVKARNMEVLNTAFATPLDREDMFRAINTIDMVLNYMKTTIREMQVLNISADEFTVEMAVTLREGVLALQSGYMKLKKDGPSAEVDCQAVAKSERNMEKIYRKAVAQLFTAPDVIAELEAHAAGSEEKAMVRIMDMFRRREVYRHLSNAGDELAKAGSTLHDIVVQSN